MFSNGYSYLWGRMRCLLGHVLSRLACRGNAARRNRPAPRRRLGVEGLEDRQLLSAASTLAIPGLPVPVPASPAGYALLNDVNLDGVPDVVFSSGHTVQVYLGSSDGSYSLAFQATRSPGLRSFFLGVGDLNRDGRTDFVTVSRLASSRRSVVNMLLENRDGSYKASAQVVNNPAALDSLFAHGTVDASVLWRGSDRPAVVAAGPAALPSAQPARAPHDPGDDPTDSTPDPTDNHASSPPADDSTDHDTATGPTELSLRAERGPDTPRAEAGPDGGPLAFHPADGTRADSPVADGAVGEGAGGADRLVRAVAEPGPVGDTGTGGTAQGAGRRHAGAVAVAPDGTDPAGADAAAGLVVSPAALLAPRPGGFGPAANGVTALVDARRLMPVPVGDLAGPVQPPSSGGAAGAALRRVQLSVQDIERILAQAFYLGTLKQSGAGNGPGQALEQVPGDTRLLVADLVQRTSEVFARVVQGFFALFLARAALPGEESGWVNMLLGGQTEEQVLSAFLSTAEFGRRADALIDSGSSDERFIRALYALLLRRPATDAEVSGWLAALPGLDRGGVASFLLRSAEYRSLQIAAYHEELLQRPATPSEVTSWASSPFDLLTVRAFLEARLEQPAQP